MSARTQRIDAIVLRTLRFGEADIIAHVLTAEDGRRGVIAKGARRSKSRLGARLEPSLHVQLEIHVGRGSLATVRSVDVVGDGQPHIRSSWRAQQASAQVLDLVYRLTEEHQPVEAAFHLLARWLVVLDSVSGAQTDAAADDRFATLVAAFELKLLHSLGLAPQLASCVRCGAVDMLTGFSGADGGIICASCMQTPDVHISAEVYGAAVHLMQAALADTAREQFSALDIRSVRELIVAPTCLTHAGVRLGSRG